MKSDFELFCEAQGRPHMIEAVVRIWTAPYYSDKYRDGFFHALSLDAIWYAEDHKNGASGELALLRDISADRAHKQELAAI